MSAVAGEFLTDKKAAHISRVFHEIIDLARVWGYTCLAIIIVALKLYKIIITHIEVIAVNGIKDCIRCVRK